MSRLANANGDGATLEILTKPAKKVRATTTRVKPPTKAERAGKDARTKVRRRLACVVGGIATGVVGLSVVHVTDAIASLTSSHWALAGLLAIGIDAGMVAAEIAEIAAHEDAHVQKWATRYVVVAVVLSMGLNAYAFANHATSTVSLVSGVVLGVVIPGLVYMLGRLAGYLAKGTD